MARDLINSQIEPSFRIYDRLKSWANESKSNNLVENATVCCELIEANASVQHELFRILRIFVSQGSFSTENGKTHQDRAIETPVVTSCCYGNNSYPVSNFTNNVLREIQKQQFQPCMHTSPQKKEIQNTSGPPKDVPRLENEILERLIQSQIQCDRLANQLKAQSMELIQPTVENKSVYSTQKRPRPTIDNESVFNQSATGYNARLPSNTSYDSFGGEDDYQKSENSYDRSTRYTCDRDVVNFSTNGQTSALNPTDLLQSWLSPLVSRYNDLFTNLRVSCMRRLQSFGQTDCERNQRLIFHAVQAGFLVTSHVIRRLFTSMHDTNSCLRKPSERQLSIFDTPLSTDQLEKLVAATFRRLSRHPPPECACHITINETGKSSIRRPTSIRRPITSQELSSLTQLLKEICSLAWHLLAEKQEPQSCTESTGICLVWYVDVDKSAKPGDAYDDRCYRRSYDSDAMAGQVHHYIWPCLFLFTKEVNLNQLQLQRQQFHTGNTSSNQKNKIVKACVLVKGEACTRNPINLASQRDKAAALLNHEHFCHFNCRNKSPVTCARSRSTSCRRM
ncbi:unnamed protein product [Trichobilharzia szidati]|nr:unnamed protein product [Trichobilharzia szidati]